VGEEEEWLKTWESGEGMNVGVRGGTQEGPKRVLEARKQETLAVGSSFGKLTTCGENWKTLLVGS
jgi:hypothetical protein